MQLDADEGADPFYKQPAPQPAPAEPSKPDQPAPTVVVSEDNDVEAAAIATIEQES
jgi:hypothetical protein